MMAQSLSSRVVTPPEAINKASLADLKESLKLTAAFDKDGKPQMDKKTNMPKLKSLQAKLDPAGSKIKKLSKKMFVISGYNEADGTVRITGKDCLT